MIHIAPEPSGRERFDALLRRLLTANWEDPEGPIRLSQTLSLKDLASATFFQNARVLLTALAESGGTAATATGNLNRVFVRQMFDRISLPAPSRKSILLVCKVFNEVDVWDVHLARIVCQCAGLIVRRQKRFQVTRAARDLLSDDQAGILYRRLFLAHFRKFDLHYQAQHRNVPSIQQTMAVILWRLDTVAQHWVPVQGLAPQLLLPGVLDELRSTMTTPYDKEEWILSGYVLNPLCALGLIEKQSTSDWTGIREDDSIRVTACWKKFISFDRIG